MNKFTNKVAGKGKLFLPIALAILIAGIVIAAIFGLNVAPEYDAEKTLKIHVNSYYSDARAEAVENVCGKVLSDKSVDESYVRVQRSTSANDYTIVYSFKGDFSDDKLEEVRGEAAAKLAEAMQGDGALKGLDEDLVSVSVSSLSVYTAFSKGFVLRACIAGGVLLIAAFVYAALRHKLAAGVIAAAISFVSLALTAALTAILRIPVSSTCANALFLAEALGAVFGVVVAGKMHAAETSEENEGLTAKEIVAKEMPEKSLFVAAAATLLGFVIIGAAGISPVQRLAVIAIFGVLSAYFTAGILFPAIYPPIFERLQKKRAEKRRYDYKKNKPAKEKVSADDTTTNAAEHAAD